MLEGRLAEWSGLSFAVSCANGTDAIQLALRTVGVGHGDVVLLPDATFWATFEAVVNVNAIPVTVDVSLDDGGIDFNSLERAIVETRPKAVIIVHLYGWGSSRLADLRALCAQRNVFLIEDGAQCFGTNYQGESIFAKARIATTSFYPAKVLGAAGDGGAIFTSDAAFAKRLRTLANHGRTSHYGYGDVGWNSRLDALQAGFLNIALDYLGARIASRRETAAFYHSALQTIGLTTMHAPTDYEENGYCNVVLIPDRQKKARIEAALKENGIGFGNIYPGSMSTQPGAQPYLKARFGGEVAEALCSQVINLPLFPYMTQAERDKVMSVLTSIQTEMTFAQ